MAMQAILPHNGIVLSNVRLYSTEEPYQRF
jgi:hypothetical protein